MVIIGLAGDLLATCPGKVIFTDLHSKANNKASFFSLFFFLKYIKIDK